ncbi:MAG: two-component system response regulator MtrA, partial [Chlamydiales bacterium]
MVSWSADGDQGARDFERLKPDLVVLDLMLPGRDGLTLCK